MALTTGAAPFVEAAQHRGHLFISQRYELYSAQNHEAWKRLMARIRPRWELFANATFLDGVTALGLPDDRIPRLSEVNDALRPRTGFEARPVSGYVPAFLFFDCLRRREFPTTITIRPVERLDYLPEPDIFHDLAGHVPMHTEPAFAEVLVRFGECAHAAAARIAGAGAGREDFRRLAGMVRGMARFFWFTVEFGLMRRPGGVAAYGSGLLSSYGELEHAVESPSVERLPARLESMIHQPFAIDRYQPLLYVIDSFAHLFELVGQLERAVRRGDLDAVAGGSPEVSETDLRSFVQGAV